MFYLAPLALIALLGLAADGIVPRARRPVVAAAVVAGVLPVFIPFTPLHPTSALSDTFCLLPWWWLQDHLIHLDQVRWAALVVSLAAAAAFALLPRRYALVLPALVAAYFVADRGRGRERPPRDPQGHASARSGPARTCRIRDWIDRDRRPRRLRRRPLDGNDGDALPGLRERVLQPQRRHGLDLDGSRTAGSAARDGGRRARRAAS